MSDITTKILSKRHTTKKEGVFYKEIQQTTIDSRGKIKTKIIDKIYIVRYRDNGKERLITLGKYSAGIREAYCKTKRNEFINIAQNGELPPQIENRRKKDIITLDSLADVYFDSKKIVSEDGEQKLSKSGKKQEGRYNLHIKPRLGNQDIQSLTRKDFKALQIRLSTQEKAPKTINGILALARAIINYSIKEEDLSINNPASNIKPIKEESETGVRDRFLSVEEVKKLIKKVSSDKDLYHFVKMALTTGGRLEGILNIRKYDIDTKHNTIRIKDFKNGSIYTGYFTDDAYKDKVEKRVSKLKDEDKLIDTSSRTIQRKLKPILDEMFNEGKDTRDAQNRVVIHTLRHTFASHLAINGVPIFTIKELMNHGTIDMTMRYAKLSPDTGLNAVKGLYDG